MIAKHVNLPVAKEECYCAIPEKAQMLRRTYNEKVQ
jgi:hypothetical protein